MVMPAGRQGEPGVNCGNPTRAANRLESAGSRELPSRPHPRDENGALALEDLVDDAVVTSSGGAKSLEFTQERPAHTLRVVGNRPRHRLHGCSTDLFEQPTEMPENPQE
jgi:hypothetical protein